MKNPLLIKTLLALLVAAPLFSACKDDKDEPEPDDENEQITTVRYELTAPGSSTPITIQYRDPDGDGGQAPTITPATLVLAPNVTYTGKIVLLDETKTPASNISDEVKQEADEHIFFYVATGANLTVTRTDKDSKNLEVGLETTAATGAANAAGTTGNLKITLRHQPGGIKNGTFAPGDTDVEVNFPVAVR